MKYRIKASIFTTSIHTTNTVIPRKTRKHSSSLQSTVNAGKMSNVENVLSHNFDKLTNDQDPTCGSDKNIENYLSHNFEDKNKKNDPGSGIWTRNLDEGSGAVPKFNNSSMAKTYNSA